MIESILYDKPIKKNSTSDEKLSGKKNAEKPEFLYKNFGSIFLRKKTFQKNSSKKTQRSYKCLIKKIIKL